MIIHQHSSRHGSYRLEPFCFCSHYHFTSFHYTSLYFTLLHFTSLYLALLGLVARPVLLNLSRAIISQRHKPVGFVLALVAELSRALTIPRQLDGNAFGEEIVVVRLAARVGAVGVGVCVRYGRPKL
jgi:hypothetical protein